MNAWQGHSADQTVAIDRRLRMATVWIAALLVMGCVLATLAGCAAPQPYTVTIHDLKCDPRTLAVPKGTTVTWVNKDQIPVQIQSADFGAAAAPAGQFSSEPLNPGESYEHPFDNTGEFMYSDALHPYITGTVMVK